MSLTLGGEIIKLAVYNIKHVIVVSKVSLIPINSVISRIVVFSVVQLYSTASIVSQECN